jgi:hypothetical protein
MEVRIRLRDALIALAKILCRSTLDSFQAAKMNVSVSRRGCVAVSFHPFRDNVYIIAFVATDYKLLYTRLSLEHLCQLKERGIQPTT